MNKSESKYFNTAALMDEALLLLLEKKPFEYITVKEVCEKAGVNRSTFYLHYETMADLANECLQNATEQMRKKYDGAHSLGQFDIAAASLEKLNLITPQYLRPYLEYVRENKRLYKAVLSQPAVFYAEQRFSEMYQGIFDPILERYRFPDWEKKYRISFYIKGMWAIIEEWLRADCSDDIEKVMQVLMRCVYGDGG